MSVKGCDAEACERLASKLTRSHALKNCGPMTIGSGVGRRVGSETFTGTSAAPSIIAPMLVLAGDDVI